MGDVGLDVCFADPIVRSFHPLANRSLFWSEECFNQFALAADRHAGESLEPFAKGNFGLKFEPLQK